MYWISVEPSRRDKQRIQSLSNQLLSQIEDTQYEASSNPHITIVPGFEANNPEIITLDELYRGSVSFSVTFDDYHIWPSIEKPMVVALSPADDSEFSEIRDSVMSSLETRGEIEIEPTPFHMTLFKGGDSGDESSFEIDDNDVQQIQDFVDNKVGLPITVDFTAIKMYEWTP